MDENSSTAGSKRSTANLVGTIVLSVIAGLGLLCSVLVLIFITNEAAQPASTAKGLGTILFSLSMIVVAPITLISIFFTVILALDLKKPRNVQSLPSQGTFLLTKKLKVAGIVSLILAMLSICLFLFVPAGFLAASDSSYSLYFTYSAFALIPLAILCVIWAIIYLVRAQGLRSMLQNTSESSKLID